MAYRTTNDLWWKNAVFYCLDVETFMDSDGDGIGDFAGLIDRLDYLAGLGVSCLWLLPFYPTPNRDDGYDVSDYYGVDPRLGTIGDVVELLRSARELGIRVVVDLVLNHSSDEHPWFQRARSDASSPEHDYYVWSDERLAEPEPIVLPGEETSNWAYDRRARQYYLHRFRSFQPDLNFASERLRGEVARIMGFWLELGVSGFRMDALPFIVESPPTCKLEDGHEYLRELRAFLSRRRGDAVLLGEAYLEPGKEIEFFGDGDKAHLLTNFTLNNALLLALAREDPDPLRRGLERQPEIPDECQWANFARNHDELTIEKLPAPEQAEIFERFAPDESMRIYGRGIRRRLPAMLDGDEQRLRSVYSLTFALPGAPILFYGEEIGMGDRLDLEGRMSVRTPMQWSDRPSGGFSAADRKALVRPVVDKGPYAYPRVNVERQEDEAGSLLHWMRRAVTTRRQCPEIGFGTCNVLELDDPSALGLRYDWRGGTVVTVHNLGSEACEPRVADRSRLGRLSEMLGDRRYPDVGRDGRCGLDLYGFRWFRAHGAEH